MKTFSVAILAVAAVFFATPCAVQAQTPIAVQAPIGTANVPLVSPSTHGSVLRLASLTQAANFGTSAPLVSLVPSGGKALVLIDDAGHVVLPGSAEMKRLMARAKPVVHEERPKSASKRR